MSGERIETAGEYTPTTEDVEVYFALGLVEYSPGNGYALDVAHDGFRRWLAQVTAEAEARGARSALLDFADHFEKYGGAWGRMSVVEYVRGEYLDAVAGGTHD